MHINPYLNFNGTTEAAFNFYKSVFGGEFAMVSRFSEVPAGIPVDEKDKNLLMHVSLPIGNGNVLMGSDAPSHIPPVVMGSNFNVSIHADSRSEADRLYNALSEGGEKSMPMADAFWGDYFGMLTDKFGVHWMINYSERKA